MRTLKVTNMYEMSQVLSTNLHSCSDQTNLEDIDDDFGDTQINICSAVTPELPQRNFNIRTLTEEKLNELRKSSN